MAKDEELLSELTVSNTKKKFLTVISNCLQGIEPTKLTSGDVKHIMLWEAISSYTPTLPLKLKCEACYQDIDITVDLRKINSVELPSDFKQPQDIQLDKMAKIRLATLADEIAIVDYAMLGQSSYLYSFALTLIDNNSIIDTLNYISALPTQELAKIKEWHKKYQHGPDMLAPYKCPLCDWEGNVEIPFRLDRLFQIG